MFKLEEDTILEILSELGEGVTNINEGFIEFSIFFVDFGRSEKFNWFSRVNFLIELKWRSSDSIHKEEALICILRDWEELILLNDSSWEVSALKLNKTLTAKWSGESLDSRCSTLFSVSWRTWEEFECFKRNYLRSRRVYWEDLGRGFSKDEDFKVKLRTALQLLKDGTLEIIRKNHSILRFLLVKDFQSLSRS